MPPRQPILLDENAIQNALQRKRSLRGFGADDATGVVVLSSTTRSHDVLQQRPTRNILLDENQLQKALQVKAERRRAAEESSDRRTLARSSMDRFLDDDNGPSLALPKRSRPPRKPHGKTQPPSHKVTEDTFVINETESISQSTSTRHGQPTRISKNVISKRTSRHKSLAEITTSENATNSQSISQTPVVKRPLHAVSSESTAPQNVTQSTSDGSKHDVGGRPIRRVSSKKFQSSVGIGMESASPDGAITVNHSPSTAIKERTAIKESDSRSQRRPPSSNKKDGPLDSSTGVQRGVVRKLSKKKSSKQKVITQDSKNDSPSRQPISVTTALEIAPSPPPQLQPSPSQISIQTETTQSRRKSTRPPLPPKLTNQGPSKSSIHTASTTKPSVTYDSVSTMDDHSTIPNSSDHSQPISWGCIPIPHSTQDHSSSFHSQPPSWSIRNQPKTGFSPNEYITQETMTTYTNNLGGIHTVATTTRLFHDKASADPELKVFFKKIRWEHVRNEFIILANLQVPDRFDESLRGMLEHHVRLLENGADMDRLIAIWESAIESSWLENCRDDARQLLVGPSRVIFNLKALERHYAMYQKALRAEASRQKKESELTKSSRRPRRGLLSRLR